TRGYCGGVAAPDPDSVAALYRSNDGGMTWTTAGPLARGSMVTAVLPQGVAVTDWDGTSPTYSYTLLPQNVPLKSPGGQPYPVNLGGGEWGWFDATSGKLTSNDGTRVLWQRPDGANTNAYVVGRAGDEVVAAWSGFANQPYDIKPWNSYIGTTNSNGKLVDAFSYPGSADVRAVRPVSSETLIGNVGVDASGHMSVGMPSHFHVAVIDLNTAEVHPVPEISDGLAGFNNGKNEHAFVLGAMVGNFARVNAGGDCLNVRESASTNAKSLGCFKDGVLLRLIDDGSAGSNGWAHVATPAGQPGWASTEFVET
ncbi:MAG: SH3 domain-containing protein, partial [Tepidiformaceae bacterium]